MQDYNTQNDMLYFYGPTGGILEQKMLPVHWMTENEAEFIHFMSTGSLNKRLGRFVAENDV